MYDQMVHFVDHMHDLHKQKAEAKGADLERLEREIAALDKEIDALVYRLYELTPEEIQIVEESVGR